MDEEYEEIENIVGINHRFQKTTLVILVD